MTIYEKISLYLYKIKGILKNLSYIYIYEPSDFNTGNAYILSSLKICFWDSSSFNKNI